MRTYFGDALVTGWEGWEEAYGLPDAGDAHVVASAVVGGAGVIVTDNVKRPFPQRTCRHCCTCLMPRTSPQIPPMSTRRALPAPYTNSLTRRSHAREEPLHG